ncbi:MAG TPA: hypothetical protein PLP28_12470, partial [Flavobacteriales bacterium]|nr:hypothetical protein [Flavobacteriales bacterium]
LAEFHLGGREGDRQVGVDFFGCVGALQAVFSRGGGQLPFFATHPVFGYAKVGTGAPVLSDGQERLSIYLRLPETHQEAIQHFDQLHSIYAGDGHIRITGTIALAELAELLGEGRDGFQVIALPHSSGKY